MAEDLKVVSNKLGIKVLTPTGYQDFSGIGKIIREGRIRLEFNEAAWLECSAHHPIKDKNGVFIKAFNYVPGDIALSIDGPLVVIKISYIEEPVELYDLLDVSGSNEYYTNGIVSHNCQFLSSEPLLINSLVLARLKGFAPLYEDMGFKWWFPISAKRTYLVGIDVSEGLGKDYSVIQVFEASTLTQVGEFRQDNISESKLYEKAKELFRYIGKHRDQAGHQAHALWSYENNACGKVLSTLYFNDTEFPECAELVSEGKKLGMNTSYASKSEACMLFKRLIEGNNTMAIMSEDLITEMKTFVQKGQSGSYEAQPGGTDDLVSACLIISRLVKHAASYDDEAFDRLYRGKSADVLQNESQYDEENQEHAPVPFVI